MEQLQINTALQVSRPVKDVFQAIVDPAEMIQYFISKSTGRIETGQELEWTFPEIDETVPLKVLQVDPNDLISFQWEGAKGKSLKVEIRLFKIQEKNTLIRISEGVMENDDAGIQWLKANTEGWANFLACLKAYLEYGINLRKGAFEFMKG